jgi:hypothetical protein
VTYLVLPLYEATDEPLHANAKATTDPAATEPLHAVIDPAAAGAAPTETSCLCVRV